MQSQVCGGCHFQVCGVELLRAVGATAQILRYVVRRNSRLGMRERPQGQMGVGQNAPTVFGRYLSLLGDSLSQFVREEIRLSLAFR